MQHWKFQTNWHCCFVAFFFQFHTLKHGQKWIFCPKVECLLHQIEWIIFKITNSHLKRKIIKNFQFPRNLNLFWFHLYSFDRHLILYAMLFLKSQWIELHFGHVFTFSIMFSLKCIQDSALAQLSKPYFHWYFLPENSEADQLQRLPSPTGDTNKANASISYNNSMHWFGKFLFRIISY